MINVAATFIGKVVTILSRRAREAFSGTRHHFRAALLFAGVASTITAGMAAARYCGYSKSLTTSKTVTRNGGAGDDDPGVPYNTVQGQIRSRDRSLADAAERASITIFMQIYLTCRKRKGTLTSATRLSQRSRSSWRTDCRADRDRSGKRLLSFP